MIGPAVVGKTGLYFVIATFTAAIMSSIWTDFRFFSVEKDEKVKTGGAYHMIYRNLGRSLGINKVRYNSASKFYEY
jgi:hypothetical protein